MHYIFFHLKTTKSSSFLKKKNVKKKQQILNFKLKYASNEGTTNLTNLFCLSTTSYRLFRCDPPKLTDIKNFLLRHGLYFLHLVSIFSFNTFENQPVHNFFLKMAMVKYIQSSSSKYQQPTDCMQ